ncbi:cell division protein [Sesbania bispinosa]|nr:cell division protein [Sesbania bispinosa]
MEQKEVTGGILNPVGREAPAGREAAREAGARVGIGLRSDRETSHRSRSRSTPATTRIP